MRYWLAKNDQLFYPPIFIENWSDGLLYFSFLPVITFFIQRRLKAGKLLSLFWVKVLFPVSATGKHWVISMTSVF